MTHMTMQGHRLDRLKRFVPDFVFRGAVLGVVCIALAACNGGGGGSSSGVATTGVVSFSNGQAADVVIGQPDFTSSSFATLGSVHGNPDVIGGVLYLPDYGHSRVLGFNSIPTSNGAPADFVLGAPDFSTSGTLSGATSVTDYDGRLYVPELTNNEVAVYDPIPTAATSAPNAASPQTPSFTLTAGTVGGFNVPAFSVAGGGKFVVPDAHNHRALIWNSVPTADTPPDLVLGQVDFTGASTNQGGSPDAQTMSNPYGVWTDGQRLVVADTYNHRVLIWNTFPITNDQAADLVLGQADFTSNTADRGGSTAANTLDRPYAVWVDGQQLFVADTNNSRVLIWNAWPTSNGQAADAVLGQPDFTSSSSGTTASSMWSPSGLYLYGNQLFVTDTNNNRYLVFNGTY
ncbi:MAG: hypothetical protein P8Y64_10030 [Gammaproteobacteria bacterium]